MEVASFNGIKIYNLSSGKTLPQWLSEKQRKSLRKDEEYRRRVELLQDFRFNTAAQNVKLSWNHEFVIATGTYPPQVKVFEVHELSLKFERHLTCEIVDFLSLSEDYGKIVFLQCDRTLAFHAPYGAHTALRVPKFGRQLAYHLPTCELLVGASGNEVYRLSLDEGRFRAPITLESLEGGVNCVKINQRCGLVGLGHENGQCYFWDHRSKKVVANLAVQQGLRGSEGFQITALEFCSDGLQMAVGTSSAHCLIYDLRSANPIITKEHQYGLPIIDVQFHEGGRRVLSTDAKVIKIWQNRPEQGSDQGSILTNVETPADINGVCVVKDKRGDSGLLFVAGEESRVMSYYIPALGPAPRWCSFLDSVTEELEEEKGASVYEDYKFVTKQEVDELGMQNLIGTPLLKGYMHGFFMDMKLYNKLKAVSEPQAYEDWRKKKMKEKLEEKRKSRISIQKKLPKVNRNLAQRIINKAEKEGKTDKNALNPLNDDRFSAVFTQQDFEIDEDAEEFKLRNPSGTQKQPRADEDVSENEALGGHFRQVNEDDSDVEGQESANMSDSDSVFGESSEEDDSPEEKSTAEAAGRKRLKIVQEKVSKKIHTKDSLVKKKPLFLEIAEGDISGGTLKSQSNQSNKLLKRQERKLQLSEVLERVQKNEPGITASLSRTGSTREMTFIPQKQQRKPVKRPA